MIEAGSRRAGLDPVGLAKRYADLGAGELLLQSIDRDGTKQGYDLDLIAQTVRAVPVPVVACGGAARVDDLAAAVRHAGAAAAAAGSLFVFKGRHDAVLINMPSHDEVSRAFGLAAAG
jgi:cyclase